MKSSESFAESCGYVCNIDDNSGNRCNFAKFYTKLAYKWVPGTLPAALNSLLPPYSKSYSSAENSSWKNWGKYIFPSFILRLLLLWWLRNNFSSQVTEKKQHPFLCSSTWRRGFYQTMADYPKHALTFPCQWICFFLLFLCSYRQVSIFTSWKKSFFFFSFSSCHFNLAKLDRNCNS